MARITVICNMERLLNPLFPPSPRSSKMDCLSSLRTFANDVRPVLASIQEEKVKTALSHLLEEIASSSSYLSQEERSIDARKGLLRIMAALSSYMLLASIVGITCRLLIDGEISQSSVDNPDGMEVDAVGNVSV